ncbi:hypothetical protein PCANB_002416 [Pneumocystis canis]|nr:hypothetical protein PCK1_002606 [Pneumocystis canis]KAG5438696.1 hypothetical protein PCANB_002416 [Pneumocystis canis]
MDTFHSTNVDTNKWISLYHHWPTSTYTISSLHDSDIKWSIHPSSSSSTSTSSTYPIDPSHVTHDAYTYTTWVSSNLPISNIYGYSTTLQGTLSGTLGFQNGLINGFNGTTSITPNSISEWTKIGRKDKTNHHNSVNSGPIPANPLRIYKDENGVDWISFAYSRERIRTEYTIRGDVETIDLDTLSEEFKQQNCIYPRARVPPEQYTGTRHRYETECNSIGWALATLNPCLRNKRGLIQRAVDSWRNKEPSLRSRRIRRMVALNDLHCTHDKDPTRENMIALSVIDPSSNVSPLPPQFRQLASTVACNTELDTTHSTSHDITKKIGKSNDVSFKKPKYILLDDIKRGTRVRVRVNLDEVDLEEIPDAFRRDHCVFPHRFISIHASYKEREMEHELQTEEAKKEQMINEIGWKLAWLNMRLFANRPSFLQRAVEAYRNKIEIMLCEEKWGIRKGRKTWFNKAEYGKELSIQK